MRNAEWAIPKSKRRSLKPQERKSLLVDEGRNSEGNMNSNPEPASIGPSAPDSGAVLLPHSAVSVIPDEKTDRPRYWSSFLVAVRAFVSGLIDDSAYQHVSLGREIFVIFTLNGPLVYRAERNNDVQNKPARSSRN
jgi:hypothetical protein